MSYYQLLDYKNECVGVYHNGSLIFSDIPKEDLEYTWNFNPYFNSEFVELYVAGKSCSEIAEGSLKQQWLEVKEKKNAFINSFINSKVDLNKHCFWDLVPESFLKEYNHVKNEITRHVVETHNRPENYNFLVEMSFFLEQIRRQKLNLDKQQLLFLKVSLKTAIPEFIDYKLFGTVTGRLSTNHHSFPILTLNKKHRNIIKPQNDYLLELDMNAAEIRTFLGLLGKEQPENDIHQWHMDHIFEGECLDRQQAKTRFFSWFYNSKNIDLKLQNHYDRDYLLQRHFNGKTVQSPFGRTIESDEFHALSYLIQSASNDLILRNILKLNTFLQGRKSFISFMIHDSVIIDLHSEDISLLKQLYDIFTDTEFGKFLASVKIGKDFGNLKDYNE